MRGITIWQHYSIKGLSWLSWVIFDQLVPQSLCSLHKYKCSCWGPLLNKISWHACIEYIEIQTAQQSTLNKHSHFHMAVFLTLCDKALLLQVSWGLLPEWMLDGTVYINVWNRHLIPIPTPIPITTIPTPIPTPPKRTTNDSDSDSDIGVGVWFQLRSRNRPRSAVSVSVTVRQIVHWPIYTLDLRYFKLKPWVWHRQTATIN